MPTEMTFSRINSKDMAASQPVAGVEVEAGAGEKAKASFLAQFSAGGLPENIPEMRISAPSEGLPLPRVLKEAGLCASTSDASRQIQQRAVRVNQERVEDRSLMLKPGATYLLQVGPRRFARVSIAVAA